MVVPPDWNPTSDGAFRAPSHPLSLFTNDTMDNLPAHPSIIFPSTQEPVDLPNEFQIPSLDDLPSHPVPITFGHRRPTTRPSPSAAHGPPPPQRVEQATGDNHMDVDSAHPTDQPIVGHSRRSSLPRAPLPVHPAPSPIHPAIRPPFRDFPFPTLHSTARADPLLIDGVRAFHVNFQSSLFLF